MVINDIQLEITKIEFANGGIQVTGVRQLKTWERLQSERGKAVIYGTDGKRIPLQTTPIIEIPGISFGGTLTVVLPIHFIEDNIETATTHITRIMPELLRKEQALLPTVKAITPSEEYPCGSLDGMNR